MSSNSDAVDGQSNNSNTIVSQAENSSSLQLERLDTYLSRIDEVEGWVDNRIFKPLKDLSELQNKLSVSGNILEIGVYRGRFFLAIDCLRRENEKSLAIDIFDDQFLNIDSSGVTGNESAEGLFLSNVATQSFDSTNVSHIKADSLSLNTEALSSITANYGSFRVISIDGGHTVEHTVNDLLLCQELLSQGGAIFVDDYTNMDWPGVHEGVCKYFALHHYRLAPVFLGFNKMILVNISYHHSYFKFFKNHRIGKIATNVVSMFGSDVHLAK